MNIMNTSNTAQEIEMIYDPEAIFKRCSKTLVEDFPVFSYLILIADDHNPFNY